MILSVYKLGSEVMEVVIDRNNLMFRDTSSQMITTIEGIRILKAGVLKEHPDLKDDVEWKKKAVERLKEHMNKMNTEMEKTNYVKEELFKFGYTPLYFQKAGFRTQKFRGDEKIKEGVKCGIIY